jgi:hypothetical protein
MNRTPTATRNVHNPPRTGGIPTIQELPVRSKARIAGFLYLIIIVGGLFAVGVVPAATLVPGDPAGTAERMIDHEGLYRLGLTVHVVIVLCNIPLAVLFHDVFRAANRGLATVVVLFILMAATIEGITLIDQFGALALVQRGPAASLLTGEGLQAQLALHLALQEFGFNLSLVLVGCYAVLAGLLIVRVRLLPRTVGALLAVGGLSYLIHSFATFLAPGSAANLFPYIQIPSFIGESALTVALLTGRLNHARPGRASMERS